MGHNNYDNLFNFLTKAKNIIIILSVDFLSSKSDLRDLREAIIFQKNSCSKLKLIPVLVGTNVWNNSINNEPVVQNYLKSINKNHLEFESKSFWNDLKSRLLEGRKYWIKKSESSATIIADNGGMEAEPLVHCNLESLKSVQEYVDESKSHQIEMANLETCVDVERNIVAPGGATVTSFNMA